MSNGILQDFYGTNGYQGMRSSSCFSIGFDMI